MKKTILTLLALLMIISIWAADNIESKEDKIPWIKYDQLSVGTDSSFEIMTWNIQNFPKHKFTVELAAKIISAIDPDVIGLQEMESDEDFYKMLKKLQELDPKSDWKGFRATSDSWNQNLAYLYKASILQNVNIYEIYTDEEKYHLPFPRKPLVMEFDFNGEDYFIINNHFKARTGKKNEDRRREAVKLIKKYIDTKLPNQEVFVLGDMNDSISDKADKNVFTEILADTTNYKFTDLEIASDPMENWSYPYWKYRGHLDHILITNELFDEFSNKNSEIRVVPLDKFTEGGNDGTYKYITDHRPVVLKLIM